MAVGLAPSARAVVAAPCVTHTTAAQAGSASTGCASAGEEAATSRLLLSASPVLTPSDSSTSVGVVPPAEVAVAATAVFSRDNASAGCASAGEEISFVRLPTSASPALPPAALSASFGVVPTAAIVGHWVPSNERSF